jgi:hypothetical protein
MRITKGSDGIALANHDGDPIQCENVFAGWRGHVAEGSERGLFSRLDLAGSHADVACPLRERIERSGETAASI